MTRSTFTLGLVIKCAIGIPSGGILGVGERSARVPSGARAAPAAGRIEDARTAKTARQAPVRMPAAQHEHGQLSLDSWTAQETTWVVGSMRPANRPSDSRQAPADAGGNTQALAQAWRRGAQNAAGAE